MLCGYRCPFRSRCYERRLSAQGEAAADRRGCATRSDHRRDLPHGHLLRSLSWGSLAFSICLKILTDALSALILAVELVAERGSRWRHSTVGLTVYGAGPWYFRFITRGCLCLTLFLRIRFTTVTCLNYVQWWALQRCLQISVSPNRIEFASAVVRSYGVMVAMLGL